MGIRNIELLKPWYTDEILDLVEVGADEIDDFILDDV